MAGIVRNILNQVATWWVVAPDGAGGDVYSAPVLIKCRWEDKSIAYIGQIDRRELVSNAIVFTDRKVSVGDYLALGSLLLATDPTSLNLSHKVQLFQQTPDLRSLEVLNKAVL